MQVLTRACGHDDLSSFHRDDVTTWKREMAVLVGAMMLLLELMVAIFLEKNTRKNNRNSSLSSSQTGEDESAKGTSGADADAHP